MRAEGVDMFTPDNWVGEPFGSVFLSPDQYKLFGAECAKWRLRVLITSNLPAPRSPALSYRRHIKIK